MRSLKSVALLAAVVVMAAVWQHRAPTASASADPAASSATTTHAALPSFLPPQARATLAAIGTGGPFAHHQDGVVFGNYEGLLPKEPRGYYHEYTVETPGARSRGARRIITGGNPPTVYYLHRRPLPQLSPLRGEPMSTRELRLDLTRPMLGGVYSVDQGILGRLADEAKAAELAVCRASLAGCSDKAGLLAILAAALSCPPGFGDNWDALADCLRDLSWLPQWGHVLLLADIDGMQQAAPEDVAILLGILDDAATFAIDRDRPFFAFLGHAHSADDVGS